MRRMMILVALGLAAFWTAHELSSPRTATTSVVVDGEAHSRVGTGLSGLVGDGSGREVVNLGTVAADVRDVPPLAATPETTVLIEVVNEALEPVPTALIYVADGGSGGGSGGASVERRVDAQGSATFHRERLSASTLAVHAPGLGVAHLSIPEVAESSYRVVLKPGASISGRVVSAAPLSLVGSAYESVARVVAIDPKREVGSRAAMVEALMGSGHRSSGIGSDGSFEIDGLVAGRSYELHLAGGGLCDAPLARRDSVSAGTDDVVLEAYFIGGARLAFPEGTELIDQLPRYGHIGVGAASQAIRADRSRQVTQMGDDTWSIALDPALSGVDLRLANSGRILFCASDPEELGFTMDYRLEVPVLGSFEGRGNAAWIGRTGQFPVIEVLSMDPFMEETGELLVTLQDYAAQEALSGLGSDLRLNLTRVMDDRQSTVFVSLERGEGSEPGSDVCRVTGIPAGDYRLGVMSTVTGWRAQPMGAPSAVEVVGGETTEVTFDLSGLGSIELVPYTSSGEAFTGRLQVDLMEPAPLEHPRRLPTLKEGMRIVEVGPSYASLGSCGVVFDGPPYRLNYVEAGIEASMMLGEHLVFGAETDMIPVHVEPGSHRRLEVILEPQ